LARYERRFSRGANADRRDADILSTHINYQPWRSTTISGRYAAKWVSERAVGFSNRFSAHLVGGRLLYDLTERIDLGFSTSVFTGGEAIQYGLGVEAGYLMGANIWLSGGYNFFGYEDDELAPGGDTQKGPYLRLRMKFDEELFGGDDPAVNPTVPVRP
jgi:hypothetical protein